jgi:hypothetical protein
MSECPFCGHDPYHYVDNGVGMEAVAVTCCELGIELFDHRRAGDVTLSREEFSEIATKLFDGRRSANNFETAQDILTDIWFHFSATDDSTLRGLADRARALIPDPVGGSSK